MREVKIRESKVVDARTLVPLRCPMDWHARCSNECAWYHEEKEVIAATVGHETKVVVWCGSKVIGVIKGE